MPSGTVKKWFSDRGFGFVKHGDGDETFLHIKDWRAAGQKGEPAIGDEVSFKVLSRTDGKSYAGNLVIKGRARAESI